MEISYFEVDAGARAFLVCLILKIYVYTLERIQCACHILIFVGLRIHLLDDFFFVCVCEYVENHHLSRSTWISRMHEFIQIVVVRAYSMNMCDMK